MSHVESFGRAASGGVLAPEPLRATRTQPEFIRTVVMWETHFLKKGENIPVRMGSS